MGAHTLAQGTGAGGEGQEKVQVHRASIDEWIEEKREQIDSNTKKELWKMSGGDQQQGSEVNLVKDSVTGDMISKS